MLIHEVGVASALHGVNRYLFTRKTRIVAWWCHDGLNENFPHSLIHLNPWSLANGFLWNSLGGVASGGTTAVGMEGLGYFRVPFPSVFCFTGVFFDILYWFPQFFLEKLDMFWSLKQLNKITATNMTQGAKGSSQTDSGTWQCSSHVTGLTGKKDANMAYFWLFLHDEREPLWPGSIWQAGRCMKTLRGQEA